MKCSKCGKEIINIQKASCISGYDEKGKHENWLCEKCSYEWDKEHPCYPIDYVKKSITDFVCKKCGSTEYEIKDKPNGTGIAHGLYCAKCGFWHKWLNKEELKQYGKKDSNGEIFSRLQAENAELKRKARQLTEENAALRERLEKAVDKTIVSEMLAKYFDCPCNFSPLDEEMLAYCRDNCVDDNIECWIRVINKKCAELKGEKE